MIDFHNHILPNADDGAKTMDESIQMLRHAQNQGITDIVNTVHFQHSKMEGKRTDFDYISSIRDRLLEEMYKENIDINIHLGAEVFFNFNLLDIIDNKLTTFCNGKYMLVEFQTHFFPPNFEQHLYELKMSGITPIIAHPERYKQIQDDIQIIEKLIDSGCLIQIDAGSILSHFGEKCLSTSLLMLNKRMVHIIGSDAHGMGKRNFCLKDAINKIEPNIDTNILKIILNNPNKVIAGEDIIPFDRQENTSRSYFSMIKKIFK